jgi:hypothetical protein
MAARVASWLATWSGCASEVVLGIQFQWRSGESDLLPPPPPPRSHRRRLGLALGIVLLALMAAGASYLYWRRDEGLRAARADLQRQVDQEVLALQASDATPFLTLLDDRYDPWLHYQQESLAREAAWFRAHAQARPRVADVYIEGDQATAGLIWPGSNSRRSVWYYRRRDGAWRHVPPPAEFWGTSTQIDTGALRLMCYAPDRATAVGLALELDKLLGSLRVLYRTPSSASGQDEPVILRIEPYGPPGSAAEAPGVAAVASPYLALEPWTEDERAEALRGQARLAVARAFLARVRGETLPQPQDWWFFESLALYHAGGGPGDVAAVRASLADGSFRYLLDALAYGADGALLGFAVGDHPLPTERIRPVAYTLGEFLATHYGDRLGELVDSVVTQRSTWGGIQHTLGLSRAELEAAWAADLRERYST